MSLYNIKALHKHNLTLSNSLRNMLAAAHILAMDAKNLLDVVDCIRARHPHVDWRAALTPATHAPGANAQVSVACWLNEVSLRLCFFLFIYFFLFLFGVLVEKGFKTKQKYLFLRIWYNFICKKMLRVQIEAKIFICKNNYGSIGVLSLVLVKDIKERENLMILPR